MVSTICVNIATKWLRTALSSESSLLFRRTHEAQPNGRIGLSAMAAINVIRQRQAVHILSDGAFCDATGIVCEIGPNAFALPHLPAALAIRGSTHFMPFLVHRLSRECRSFDDMLGKIVPVALEVHTSFPMAFGTLGYGSIEPDFDIVAVGWSKSRGVPASYLVCSHDRAVAQGLTAPAWQLVELPDVLIAPPIAEKQISAVGWNVPYSAELVSAGCRWSCTA